MNRSLVLLLSGSAALNLIAAEPVEPPRAPLPPPVQAHVLPPTYENVHYGPAAKQVLDFYQARTDGPAPLVCYIHGGGWTAGSKDRVSGLEAYLKAGISVASIEYRFVPEAIEAGVKVPVEWPMHDSARALQFLRSKAGEWNLDPKRVAATGGSAGACTSLWLAFHDDLADAKSDDPVARQSTRLLCAAVDVAQTTLDPKQMREWTPNSRYGGHAFGFFSGVPHRDAHFQAFFDARESLLPAINEYSPYALVTPDDPPIYLIYSTAPGLGEPQKDPTHTANFGVKLQEHCKEIGVACELVYPGAPEVKHPKIPEFLIEKLSAPVK